MVDLKFVLTTEGCGRVHDALTCLAKFSDGVTVEASTSQLVLTALNLSKSAYVCFTLDKSFFESYSLSSKDARNDRFSCQMLNKALSSVFKGRVGDARQRDIALDRCEVTVHDTPEQIRCRFNIKMICRHGVNKTYSLTYESTDTMRALFDKDRATNVWKIHSKHLREYIEFFAPKTEQLDIYAEDGKCTFLSFTEKISQGKEVLKQPLQTAVSIDVEDFVSFNAIDNLHVVINVKDFKNMVVHAETLRSVVTAMYSEPSRPLQFSYGTDGVQCEFTLMTIGDPQIGQSSGITGAASREPSSRPTINPGRASETRRETRSAASYEPKSRNQASMDPPRLGRRTTSIMDAVPERTESDSLFITEDDNNGWEPAVEHDQDQDFLGWDASMDNDATFRGNFRHTDNMMRHHEDDGFDDNGIAPTQRASQVRGMFD